MRLVFRICLLSALMAATLSCSNILSEFGDQETNEALWVRAKLEINDQDWDAAIATFQEMESSFRGNREVALDYAGAYMGRCGVDFLGFVEDLSSIGSSTLFLLFMQLMTGGTASDAADCKSAETIIRGIDVDATDRTDDENLVLAIVSLAKIGLHISLYADETNNDGTPDGGFNSCANNATPGIPDADAAEVATGFTNARASLQQLVSTGALDVSGLSADDFNSICTALAGVGPSYDFCADFDSTSITGNKQKAVRSIIQENTALGIGSCAGDISTCLCP